MIANNDKTFIVPQTPLWTLQPAAAFFTAAFAATCIAIAQFQDLGLCLGTVCTYMHQHFNVQIISTSHL
jgi:hypothetical protein